MEMYGSQSGQQQVGWAQETGLEETMRRLSVWEEESYPERPDLPDCKYYMRIGSCGYGAKCRYNHPRDLSISVGGEEYPERVGEPPCQFFLRTGICKFGASCKFNHPKNAGGSLTNAPLNTFGYPLRQGEKQCSYYLKTGQCKFGITCKYDHPHPAGMTMPASARPFYPTLQSFSSQSPEQYDSSATNYRVAKPPPMLSVPYVAGAYGPMVLHHGMVPVPNWNPYSGPGCTAPSCGAQHSRFNAPSYSARHLPVHAPSPGVQHLLVHAPSQFSLGATCAYGTSQIGSSAACFPGPYSQVPLTNSHSGDVTKEHQYPERHGQPDCKFYIRTGECKYASSCRYNHPPNCNVLKPYCALSPSGLPLRPVEYMAWRVMGGQGAAFCKMV